MSTTPGGQQPQVRIVGTVEIPLVPVAAIHDYLAVDARLGRARGVTQFFAGAALATLPSLTDGPSALVVVAFVAELLIALITGAVWIDAHTAATTARQRIEGPTLVIDYPQEPPTEGVTGAVKETVAEDFRELSPPPPTSATKPEGWPPDEEGS